MIVSHKYRFIFIKTRKTAGTSIEIALSSICGDKDIITAISPEDEIVRKELGYCSAQNFIIPFKNYSTMDFVSLIKNRRRLKFYNHMSASEMKKYLGEDIWNSYYKFTFDRNPFDKIVSLYFWRSRNKEYGNMNNFLKTTGLLNFKSYDLYSINKLVAVDKVYKYEELNEALIDISMKIGLSNKLKLPEYRSKSSTRKNKSYKDILDKDAIKIIKIAFAREIELLNYNY